MVYAPAGQIESMVEQSTDGLIKKFAPAWMTQQHHQLMAERRVLSFKPSHRLEW
jgi:hypothetical protein